ncbi:hypothetical protein FACS189427_08000 [Planctomycetales bacterium]|nr:hypothetical protein FACS189427_08000 [Planctomycetales bacterium]
MFLKNLLDDIQNESIAKLILRTNVLSVTKAEIEIEKGDRYILDFDGVSLFISTDRVLTVPRGLYEKKNKFLIGFVEKIRELTKAISISSEIQIQFEDKKNPYYGFFVNSLPADLLDSFDVSLRTDTESECIVIANNDGITVKGKNLLDTFTTLKDVLLLQPLNHLL